MTARNLGNLLKEQLAYHDRARDEESVIDELADANKTIVIYAEQINDLLDVRDTLNETIDDLQDDAQQRELEGAQCDAAYQALKIEVEQLKYCIKTIIQLT